MIFEAFLELLADVSLDAILGEENSEVRNKILCWVAFIVVLMLSGAFAYDHYVALNQII